MRSNVEQYIILLESSVTPEHLRVHIRTALLILGDLADTVSSIGEPLEKEDEAEQEGKEIYSGAVTSETEEGEPTAAYVMQDPDLKTGVDFPEKDEQGDNDD